MADPGFPVGGSWTRWGGMDLRRGCFLAKMYVKMKEFGPIGGVRPARPLDPPMHPIAIKQLRPKAGGLGRTLSPDVFFFTNVKLARIKYIFETYLFWAIICLHVTC